MVRKPPLTARARRVASWWPRLDWLARTYQVGVIHVPVSRFCDVLNSSDDPAAEDIKRGAGLHSLDLKRRRVFLVHDDQSYYNTRYDTVVRSRYVEKELHEIIHIIAHPPWYEIEDLGEDWMLMPYERAVARALFLSRGDRSSYKAIVSWQEATTSTYFDRELGLVDGYVHTNMWKNGLLRARSVGLLNDHNWPTWQMPNWEAMPRKLRSIKEYNGYG